MAETKGLVQRIKFDATVGGHWVYIGPSPTNTTLFGVGFGDPNDVRDMQESDRRAEALNGALFARREVIVTYDQQNPANITALDVVPG